MVVEINNTKDPAKTVTTVQWDNHVGGCYVKTIEIRMTEEKEILIDLIEERTILEKPASTPLGSCYHPETGSSSIREVIEGRNGRIKIVTTSACLAMKRFRSRRPLLMCLTADSYRLQGKPLPIALTVGSNGEAFLERP